MPGHAVQTLDEPRFRDACAALMRLVEGSYAPDLLVGIPTGGMAVAAAMARAARAAPKIAPLTCRRPATGAKARLPFLPAVLRRLPRPVTDRLRVMEVRLLSARRRSGGATQRADQDEAAAIGATAARGAVARLLVVDDAVDSGVTLASVLRALRGVCPSDTEIRAAAITVTLDNPVAEPDYALYRHVVCRFPWSFDAGR